MWTLRELITGKCRFARRCPLYQWDHVTCNREAGPYCGKYRELLAEHEKTKEILKQFDAISTVKRDESANEKNYKELQEMFEKIEPSIREAVEKSVTGEKLLRDHGVPTQDDLRTRLD